MTIDGKTIGQYLAMMQQPLMAPDGVEGGGAPDAGGTGDAPDGGGQEASQEDGQEDGQDQETEAKAAEYVDDPALTEAENEAARAKFNAEADNSGEDGDGDDEDDKSDLIGAPDGDYEDFEVPEGFELAGDVKTEFDEVSRELNLSDAGRKKLVEMQAKLYNKQAEAHADRVAEWGESAKSDKIVGGAEFDANVGVARANIKQCGDAELKELLETTGIGNHPAFIRYAYRNGKATGEAGVEPGGGHAEEDAATILYGSSS